MGAWQLGIDGVWVMWYHYGMERTKVRTGSVALAPAASAKPEACQRAPTLMAGQDGESHGEVRVWSPNLGKLRACFALAFVGVPGAYCVTCLWLTQLAYHSLQYYAMHALGLLATLICIQSAVETLASIKRPFYLTTDDAGIGITTSWGSRAMPWSGIQSLTIQTGLLKAVLRAEDWNWRLDLLGYSSRERRELRDLILERAHLAPDPTVKNHFVRDPAALPGATTAALQDRNPTSLPS